MWSKRSNLTSLLLVDVFAEVAEVNSKARNIKSYHCRRKCRGKMYFHGYLDILFAAAKNAEIQGLNGVCLFQVKRTLSYTSLNYSIFSTFLIVSRFSSMFNKTAV